jgi:osmoprotectant transport system permease protein
VRILSAILLFIFVSSATAQAPPVVTVGSKAFPESMIVGEMIAHLVRSTGISVRHDRTRGLGGTQVLWKALLKGDIDVYPEYTGSISEEILAGQNIHGESAMRNALASHGILMSRSLGFNDNYAIGIKEDLAERLGIRRISDLAQHPELRLGFSNEFMKRADGWPGLQRTYDLPQRDVRGVQHELAYRALNNGAIQATELYTTDAQIQAYHLRVLEDDRHYFPGYRAVLLYRAELTQRAPAAVTAFLKLQGAISEAQMAQMNARASNGVSTSQVAADFVNDRFGLHAVAHDPTLWELTWQHLFLVAVSLGAAVIVSVPLGVLAVSWPRLGQVILAISGIVQTIPSLALLVLLIPLVGLGAVPAIIALFLYSLLPIIRNTYTGLHDIPPQIREAAAALGLPRAARLRLIELPMVSRSILAGIKTSAIINVGTATLGGFIGAGGYGQPIFTGIPLNNMGMVLEGAIPAALLALLVQGLFELAERFLVPRGLRLKAAG